MTTFMDDYYNGESDEKRAPDPWDLAEADTYDVAEKLEHSRTIRRTALFSPGKTRVDK